MQQTVRIDLDEMRRVVRTTLKTHWKTVTASGGVLLALGAIAIVLPQIATLATELLVGWLFLIGGLFRLLVAWRLKDAPGHWGSLAAAALSMALGVILLGWPLQGAQTLTMLLVALFLIEGVAVILFAVRLREHFPNWGWMLFSGMVDLLLAGMIWQSWPSSATWAIGLLVGVNLLFTGLSLVMLGLAARDMPVE